MEQAITKATEIFGKLIVLSLDSSGLVYYNPQFAVTLIIPEAAVNLPTTVWFGACFCSTKLNFGDYVPVTPIVWVYSNHPLTKPIEIYLPHHVDTLAGHDWKDNFSLLTADNESCQFLKSKDVYEVCIVKSSKILRVLATNTVGHYLCACDKSRFLQRRFLMGLAEKREAADILVVEICFIYDQLHWIESVKQKYQKKGFHKVKFENLYFDRTKKVSLEFDPEKAKGWRRRFVNAHYKYTTEEQIDYFSVAKDEGVDRIEELDCNYLYPPTYSIKFSRCDRAKDACADVKINIIGSENCLQSSVKLAEESSQLSSQLSTLSSVIPKSESSQNNDASTDSLDQYDISMDITSSPNTNGANKDNTNY